MPISRHPLTGPIPSLPGVRPDADAVKRLRRSLELFGSRGTSLTRDFYEALFARYPGVRVLFPSDMRAQEGKLFDSLKTVVEHLEDAPEIRKTLMELGRRHVRYGAKAEHYPIVCALLLESMAKFAGQEWTADLAAEWSQALRIVGDTMIRGAESPAP